MTMYSEFLVAFVLPLSCAARANHAGVGFVGLSRPKLNVATKKLSFVKSPAFQVQQQAPLLGILDEVNSDAFILGGDDSKSKPSGMGMRNMEDAYEIFLADLVFSPNDPRLDIVEKWDQATDPAFTEWLKKKSEVTRDAEEKVALKDLLGMITDLMQKVELSQLAAERERVEQEEKAAAEAQDASVDAQVDTSSPTKAEILKRASAVSGVSAGDQSDAGTATKKKTFLEQALTPEIRISYQGLLKELLPPYDAGITVAAAVFNAYDRCDAQLLKILEERSSNGDSDAQSVLDAIAEEQQKRVAAAAERLKTVVTAGDPRRMEGIVVKLAKEGRIDEPFLLLLEANADQARRAGAEGVAVVMNNLKERALSEKDKMVKSKEIALLRKLLRTAEAEKREEILTDAFTPREKLLVQGTAANAAKAMDGEAPDQEKPMPDVPPPDFIAACKAVLINFGNLGTQEKGDLSGLVKQIATEAEVVATRIYGKGMTPQEQQDRAWKETTTSIFDLETLEIEAERMGDSAPWTNPNNDDILPGFDADGRMKIGGS